MFLAEAALGRQHEISSDDSSLRSPPPGASSPCLIHAMTSPARGRRSRSMVRCWNDIMQLCLHRHARGLQLACGTQTAGSKSMHACIMIGHVVGECGC